MAFLLRALQNKKPRYSQDKYESFSEVSNSPQHTQEDVIPKIKKELIEKSIEKPETQDKCNQATIDTQTDMRSETKTPSLERDSTILPEDHFDDDKLFMNSLLPFFKKMDDDARLLCRIEMLKIIRYALEGNKRFDALKIAEDTMFKNRISSVLSKDDNSLNSSKSSESRLSMTTRSADGSRPVRKRKTRSPSPLPSPPKRRGPGRPRKIRPPPSDSEEESLSKKRPRMRVPPVTPRLTPAPPPADGEDSLCHATSVAQLSTPMFMKMYNLGRSKDAPLITPPQNMLVSVKTEPVDDSQASN